MGRRARGREKEWREIGRERERTSTHKSWSCVVQYGAACCSVLQGVGMCCRVFVPCNQKERASESDIEMWQ